MTRRRKLLISGGVAVAVIALAASWIWSQRAPLIKEIALDLRAGVQARNAEKPFEKFIELRYGPMNEATNRQKAFVGFFDPNHVEAMYRMVKHMNADERRGNIAGTAEWLAKYRENMTPEERDALAGWLQSPEGKANVQKASALYRSRDIGYRSSTEPVIVELMTTLAALQQEGAQ